MSSSSITHLCSTKDSISDGNSNRLSDQTTNQSEQRHYTLLKRNPYDVHVYYKTPDEKETAMILRQRLHSLFGTWMRFYTPKDVPIGPHPYPMWEADFGGYEYRERWGEVVEFLKEYTNSDSDTSTNSASSLSILIHPHSEDGDYMDHTEHAYWIGEKLKLKTDRLR